MSQSQESPSLPSQSDSPFITIATPPRGWQFEGVPAPEAGQRVFITIATKETVLANTMKWTWRPWLRFNPDVVFDCVPDNKPLQDTRNRQVIRFLETDCSRFFVLDSDCRPQNGTIAKLLAYDLPIIAAPHRTIKGNEIGLMVLDRDGAVYRQHTPLTGLQGPNIVVGCAGLMVQREVFETMLPPWFENHYDKKGLLTKSEDFDFCDKAHALGMPVWADCDLPQLHKVSWMA